MKNLNLSRNLPILGIVAFSMASTWSLYQFFLSHAQHDTYVFLPVAVMVELTTAWLIFLTVRQAHAITRTRITKQDRKFYTLMLVAFVALVVPTLTASVVANYAEFGSVLLAVLFPISSIACACAAGVSDVVTDYERMREKERQERKASRSVKPRKVSTDVKRQEPSTVKDRQVSSVKPRQVSTDVKRQEPSTVKTRQASSAVKTQRLDDLLEFYADNPLAGPTDASQVVGVSRQQIYTDLKELEQSGRIERNGHGVAVVS